MIENQEDLRAALETQKAQQDRILQLKAEKAQLESRLSNAAENRLVDELQIQVPLKCAAYHMVQVTPQPPVEVVLSGC